MRIFKTIFALLGIAVMVIALGFTIVVSYWVYGGTADVQTLRLEHAISGMVMAVIVVGSPPLVMYLMRPTPDQPRTHEWDS